MKQQQIITALILIVSGIISFILGCILPSNLLYFAYLVYGIGFLSSCISWLMEGEE